MVYYPDLRNQKSKHRVEVKNVKLRERGVRGLAFDGDSMRASLFRNCLLDTCSPFFVSFCLFIDGYFSHFVGSDRSIEYSKTILNMRIAMFN
jgi:hypothetical protein